MGFTLIFKCTCHSCLLDPVSILKVNSNGIINPDSQETFHQTQNSIPHVYRFMDIHCSFLHFFSSQKYALLLPSSHSTQTTAQQQQINNVTLNDLQLQLFHCILCINTTMHLIIHYKTSYIIVSCFYYGIKTVYPSRANF